MKKFIQILTTIILGTSLFAACSSQTNENVISVGATPAPHAEILEFIQPQLAAQGYKLDIVEFNDYYLPNKALDAGEIDANYFQHSPFLALEIKEKNYDIVEAGKIHIEPIGVYSNRYKSLAEIKDHDEVVLSNSIADHGRALSLLEIAGLITLDPKLEDKTAAEVSDITENKKQLTFKYDFSPELLPKIYQNDEAPLVIINTNFAIGAGINPSQEALIIEDSQSPYTNVIAVQTKDKESDKTKALITALTSSETQDFIKEKYKGAVVPA